jgi:hypothetical protein
MVLTVIHSPSRSPLRNQDFVQSIAQGLGPDARLVLLAPPEMILDPNPMPERLRFVPLPDAANVSIWPQDPFVVLRDESGAGRLLAARDYGRVDDREMPGLVAAALGWPVTTSSLFFAGGNLLSDERHAFVAPDLIRTNAEQLDLSAADVVTRFEEELGRAVLVVGSSPQPVAHIDMVLTPLGRGRVALADPGQGAGLARRALAEQPAAVAAFERHAEDWFFGHPGLRSLTGPDGTVLHAPQIVGRTPDAIADSAAAAGAVDAIGAELERSGYSVLRIPLLMTRLDRPEHLRRAGGNPGYPMLTYNNVLVETAGGREIVYLPRYGFSALDDAAAGAWRAAGFEVRPIGGATTSAMYRGSLRCAVKVLTRSGSP